MKLFIVSPHFPPSALPPSQRVRLMLPYLSEHQVQTTIFTVDPRYREEMTDQWMVELAGNNFDKVVVNCLSQKTTRKFGFGDLGFRLSPFLFFRLLKEIKNRNRI